MRTAAVRQADPGEDEQSAAPHRRHASEWSYFDERAPEHEARVRRFRTLCAEVAALHGPTVRVFHSLSLAGS